MSPDRLVTGDLPNPAAPATRSVARRRKMFNQDMGPRRMGSQTCFVFPLNRPAWRERVVPLEGWNENQKDRDRRQAPRRPRRHSLRVESKTPHPSDGSVVNHQKDTMVGSVVLFPVVVVITAVPELQENDGVLISMKRDA
jgi:hypothetical protein